MRWLDFLRRLFGRWRPRPDPPPPGPDPPQGDMAAQAMEYANEQRSNYGSPPLVYSKCLANQAQRWAEEMQRRRRMGHEGFPDRLSTCGFGVDPKTSPKGTTQPRESYPAGCLAPVTERTCSRPHTYRQASAMLTMMVGIGGV